MRAGRWVFAIGALLVGACGSPAVAPTAPPADDADAAAPEAPSEAPAPPPAPRTKASYDEAMSAPETIDMRDDRPQLTDAQLTAPMKTALSGCRPPANAKITIRTAVQNGRAIGVSIDVRFTRAKASQSAKPTSRAEIRAANKLATCIDHNVRALTWPSSGRRDSFTTEY